MYGVGWIRFVCQKNRQFSNLRVRLWYSSVVIFRGFNFWRLFERRYDSPLMWLMSLLVSVHRSWSEVGWKNGCCGFVRDRVSATATSLPQINCRRARVRLLHPRAGQGSRGEGHTPSRSRCLPRVASRPSACLPRSSTTRRASRCRRAGRSREHPGDAGHDRAARAVPF